MYRFGYSPTALGEGRCCRGRIAQGYQGPLLPHRVRVTSPLPFNLLLTRAYHLRHMGISVVQQSRGDIDKIIGSLRDSLEEARANKR